MPVFHTKTIESILDPVAQQVNNFIVLLFFSRMYINNIGGYFSINYPHFLLQLFCFDVWYIIHDLSN